MSANLLRQPGISRHDGDSYYPAPLPAGPWVVPLFWLVVLLLAVLFWFA